MSTLSVSTPVGASFLRRSGAWLYDMLVVVAIEMLAGALVLAGFAIAGMAGFSLGEYVDVGDYLARHPVAGPLYTFYLVSVAVAFFSFFWCRAGQTLGMRAWKLRLQNNDGSTISFTQSVIRLSTACFGIGNVLAIVDPKKRAFQDHFAKCQMVKVDTV